MLAEAIAKIERLPPEEQELIGRWLMDELASERAWASRFEASADKLSELAAEVRADIADGSATDFDPEQL